MPPQAPPVETPAPDKPARFAPKLLIVGGAAAALLLALSATAAVLLWPSEAKPPVAKKPKVSVPANTEAASAAAGAASAVAGPEATVTAAIAPLDGPVPAQAAAAPAPRALPPATVRSGAAGAPAHEDPMDRLRRRLGETIAGNAELDAGSAGELRLRTRAAAPLAAAAPVAPMAPAASSPQALAGAVPANRGVAARPARGRAADWSYEGSAGPQAWARLDPAFAKCASGQRQSPIDIRGGIALDLEALQFDYRPSRFSVIDNGHTVQVDLAAGNFIETMGRRYALRQFHFHRPSEERIDGRRFEMVVHLVHESDDGRLAMVAVLLDRGAAQPLLQTVWNNLPLEKGEPFSARPLIDLNQLLPDDRRYYTYMGSMTTPPCSEGVLWIVMQQPVPVSPSQIDIFSRLYPMNARPMQDAAGRMIKQSN